jgi:tetratricopeptide (TPR) repeat protein
MLGVIGCALALCVVVEAVLAAEPATAEKPPWQRLLQGADARKAEELQKRLDALVMAGKFDEALASAEELARLRQDRQGQEHWEAVNARFAAEAVGRALRSTPEDRQKYGKSFQLEGRASALAQQGRYQEALPLWRQILAIRRQVLGEEHPDTATCYNEVAYSLNGQGKYPEAAESFGKALSIRRQVLGKEHPDTANSHNSLGYNLHHQGRYAEAAEEFRKALAIRRQVLGEEHPDTVRTYHNLAFNLHAHGKYAEAEEGLRKALAIRRKVLGEEHRDIADSYDTLAANLTAQGKYAEAEEFARKALAIDRKVLGEEHPLTANSYSSLAVPLTWQGKYQEAEEATRKALAIRRKVLGEEHPDTADSYISVASDLQAQGKHAEAAEGYRKALDIYRTALGEEHPGTARGYVRVASNLTVQGKYAVAEECYQKALNICRKALGEEHPLTANIYSNVGANFQDQARYAEAEEAYQKALEIYRKVDGEEHPFTASCYNNLALNRKAQGKYAAAAEGYRKALDICRKVLGEEHPWTAQSYNNVAGNLKAQGKYAKAAEGYRKALAIRRKVLGEEHPDTANSYNNLAFNLHAQGKYAEAEELWQRAAASFASARLHLSRSGLERATLTSQHSPLPALAAVLARNGKLAEAWQRYEESLARGTWDDLSARLRRPAGERAQQAGLVARLERLDGLLEKALAVREESPQQKKAREDLLGQRRKAQEDLDTFARHLEETYGLAAGQVLEIERIQKTLEKDMALLGWLDIPPAGPKAADANGEHWAFLLRASGPPICLRLKGSGPGGAWTDDDSALPSLLRDSLLERRGDWQRLARQVREQRLGPLRGQLAAEGKLPAVRQLVVLPSPALAGVPLETLAEDWTISYALSGTLQAHLKTQPAVQGAGLLALGDPIFDPAKAPAKDKPLPPGGLLLTLVQPGSNAALAGLKPNDVLLKYGDTDLKDRLDLKLEPESDDKSKRIRVTVWRDGKTSEVSIRPGKLGVVLATDPAPKALAERYRLDSRLSSRSGDDGWPQLPGTRVEVESLRRLFAAEPKPLVLLDSEASEQKLDALATAGELGKYRFVHLATHGEVDNSRALHSAILLSRDNLPDAQEQLLAGKPVYDGRLTAEEMLRSWNLDCELVTLSACQTALGKYERGEGFVGFAQALILCGSRSVCLSLWKVDDAATALLMQRFYANLLGKREGLKAPLPKAAALAEAKRWLRTLPREQALKQAAALYQGIERSKGRPKLPVVPELPKPMPEAKEDRPYAHPYYWAAFVLTGDPS